MNEAEVARLQAKTKEQQLIHMLQTDYQQSPRMAQVLLEDLQACWAGGQVQPGQMRVMLVALTARHGQALAETRQTEVVWTVDAGAEDYEVQRQYGMTAVRQQHIQRLLDEAVAQGAVASQEDLARVLQVSVRTIKRDCAVLEAQGVYLPTRGHLKGIGRGQTHKALIVGRWLQGETYDQISRATHHAVSSVQRYVQAFCRVMQLQQQGLPIDEIAVLVQLGWPLVADYQAIYAQHATPFVQTRLAAQLERLQQRGTAEKKRRS